MNKTRNSLTIMWPEKKEGSSGSLRNFHAEVDGIYFYGSWDSSIPDTIDLGEFSEIWAGSRIECLVKKFEANEYKTLSVQVKVLNWPAISRWENILNESLRYFIDIGAAISWCGDETSSPAPIDFDPARSGGNIYAFFAPNIGFVCNSSLDEEYKYVGEDQLLLAKDLLEKKNMLSKF